MLLARFDNKTDIKHRLLLSFDSKFFWNTQQLTSRLNLQTYVEWSRKLKLIKRLYQFQKLMPHINYFPSFCVSSFKHPTLQSFLYFCIYIQSVLLVQKALIVIFWYYAFYKQFQKIDVNRRVNSSFFESLEIIF